MDNRRHGEGIQKFLEVNKNKEASYRNFWDTMKAVLIGKFISWSAFNKKKIKSTNKQPDTMAQGPSKRRTKQHQE